MQIVLEAEAPREKPFLTEDEFRFAYSRVPCLCIDIVIVQNGGVLFCKREIEPFKGFYTLPGGIWRYKEPFEEAFARLLKKELGVTCLSKKLVGFIQHLHDGEFRSSVSLAFLTTYDGQISGNNEGREFRYIDTFTSDDVQPYQAAFFRENLSRILAMR